MLPPSMATQGGIFFNSQSRIIAIEDITEGTVNQAHPIIREIFQKALQHFAVSMICVHNHPSGATFPSVEDRLFTARLFKSGEIMQPKVLDNIIIANNGFYSFKENS